MPHVIECAGHPRDMGLEQGLACRSDIRERLERARLPLVRSRAVSLRPYVTGRGRGGGRGRELVRHYTHLSERIDGLARGACVPVDAVLDLHLRAAAGDEIAGGLGADAVALAGRQVLGASGALLMRGLPEVVGPGSAWVVRRSRPEVGFASLEVTLPWLVSSVAGVNAVGLCVAMASIPKSIPGSAPPSLLLVQECLQRFEGIEGALDWCLERPASGDITLLLADASGALASIEQRGRERLLSRSCDTAWCKAAGEGSVSALLTPPGSPPPSAWVRVDGEKRRLVLESLGAPRELILLDV